MIEDINDAEVLQEGFLVSYELDGEEYFFEFLMKNPQIKLYHKETFAKRQITMFKKKFPEVNCRIFKAALLKAQADDVLFGRVVKAGYSAINKDGTLRQIKDGESLPQVTMYRKPIVGVKENFSSVIVQYGDQLNG